MLLFVVTLSDLLLFVSGSYATRFTARVGFPLRGDYVLDGFARPKCDWTYGRLWVFSFWRVGLELRVNWARSVWEYLGALRACFAARAACAAVVGGYTCLLWNAI